MKVVTLLCDSTSVTIFPMPGPDVPGMPGIPGMAGSAVEPGVRWCMPSTMSVMFRSRTVLTMAFAMFTS